MYTHTYTHMVGWGGVGLGEVGWGGALTACNLEAREATPVGG